MIEDRGINYSDEQPEQVECKGCGNKVNKSQIHDKEQVLCIGCHHRRNQDGYSKHSELDSKSHGQVKGENLLNQYKKTAERKAGKQ